jgi:hypothetical protein
MKPRTFTIFLFGGACGAWLNIWPGAFGPWGSFCFAYVLVFIALGALMWERGLK